MFSICSEISLPASCGERYRGIAFDGCHFYLTVQCECAINILDRDFCLVETVKTCRPYTAIAFDSQECAFWATSDQCPFRLFKLDCCLREVDQLTPCLKGRRLGPFSSISFCCGTGRLLVATGNRLLEVDPVDGEACLLREERGDALILTALCLSPFFLYCVLRGCNAYFVLTDCDGTLLAEEESPVACSLEALLLEPCECAPDAYNLLLLTNKHGCYPRLLCAALCERVAEALCPCNRALDCCKCEEKCHGKQACNDLLESIALQEAAIAHILNAEGEKLQRVIAETADTCELLRVNESVQKTIIFATHLEQVLFAKLDSLQSICCFCEPETPPCPPPCKE